MTSVDHVPAGVSRTDRIERLYRERGDRIWRVVLAFSTDPEVASDAVTEALAQVLRRGDEVRDPERWIWRAAFRIAAGKLKERRRSGEVVAAAGRPHLIPVGFEPSPTAATMGSWAVPSGASASACSTARSAPSSWGS
jgi:DNA-directed RNA polymerase specialized sigma24 family protein